MPIISGGVLRRSVAVLVVRKKDELVSRATTFGKGPLPLGDVLYARVDATAGRHWHARAFISRLTSRSSTANTTKLPDGTRPEHRSRWLSRALHINGGRRVTMLPST